MPQFDMRQFNTLIIGSHLAAELQASSAQLRAFVVVGAYAVDEHGKRKGASKFLNAVNQELRFWLDKYEVDKRYIDSWDVDYYIWNRQYSDDIISIRSIRNDACPVH